MDHNRQAAEAVGRPGRFLRIVLASVLLALAASAPAADDAVAELRRLSLDAPREALIRGERLLESAGATDDAPALAPVKRRDILVALGRAAMVLMDPSRVETYAAALDRLASSAALPSAAAEAQLLRSGLLIDAGNYDEGVRLAVDAAGTLRVDADPALRLRAPIELCEAFTIASSTTQARRHCEVARDEATALHDDFTAARAEHYLAYLEQADGRIDSALKLSEHARSLFEQLKMPSMAASLDDEIASLYLASGDASRALELSRNALASEQAAGREAHAALSMITTAQALSRLGRHDDARRTIADALRLIRSLRAGSLLPGALRAQLAIAEAAGDTRTALQAAKQALDQMDEQQDRESLRAVAELEAKYANLEHQRQIDDLASQNEIKQLELQRAEVERDRQAVLLHRERLVLWLTATVAAALAIGVVMLIVLLRIQRRHAGRLRALSRTDSLTGTANRREFMAALKRAFAEFENGTPASLLLIDADHFKSVNDRYGHQTGDRALVAIAAAVRSTIRSTDTLGRIGGEEFGVLLDHVDVEESMRRAQAMIDAVAATGVDSPHGRVALSISVGVSPATRLRPASPEAWFSSADEALYAAKRHGRARYWLAGTPDIVEPASGWAPL